MIGMVRNWGQEIVVVTIKHDSGTFAIQLCGARHGASDTIVPWDIYLKERVKNLMGYHALEEGSLLNLPIRLDPTLKGEEAVMAKRHAIADTFNLCLEKGLERENVTMASLAMQHSEKAFEQNESAILEEVDRVIDGFVEAMKEDAEIL